MAQINAAITASANLFALINAANTSQTLAAANVTFGTPAVITGVDNTSVLVTAVAGQGYSGTQTVTYNRRGLGDNVASPSFASTANNESTLASIKAVLVTQLALVASEVTLTGTLTNPGDGNTSTLTLASNAGSLLYIDGSSQVITLTWGDVPLTEAITTTSLAGFDVAS